MELPREPLMSLSASSVHSSVAGKRGAGSSSESSHGSSGGFRRSVARTRSEPALVDRPHYIRLLLEYLPMLISVSDDLCRWFDDDPTPFGIATALCSSEEALRDVLVPWSCHLDELRVSVRSIRVPVNANGGGTGERGGSPERSATGPTAGLDASGRPKKRRQSSGGVTFRRTFTFKKKSTRRSPPPIDAPHIVLMPTLIVSQYALFLESE
jgi:hypothetical protein